MYRADDAPETVWRAQMRKGKLRQESAALRLKMVAGVFLVLLAVGGAVYFDLH